MEVFLGVGVGITTILGILCCRFLTALVHELGHILFALILTKGAIKTYIGVKSDLGNIRSLNLRRLSIGVGLRFWNLDYSKTIFDKEIRFRRLVIILFAGPVFSFLFASYITFQLIFSTYNDGTKFILSILLFSALWDFFVHSIPRMSSSSSIGGLPYFNDAAQFVIERKNSRKPDQWLQAEQYMRNQEYEKAKETALKLVDQEPEKVIYQEIHLRAMSELGQHKAFLEAYKKYFTNSEPSLEMINLWAEASLKLHKYDDVIQKLTSLIYKGKSDYNLHFKRGKALLELGEYKEAMQDFHALTLGEVEEPLALAYRAYCQFKLGYLQEAKEDVQDAIAGQHVPMGEINFLAGVIFEEDDPQKALEFYEKAHYLKYEHHALAFNMARIKKN